MISYRHSFATALSIANMLLSDPNMISDTVNKWNIEAYQNGREQGITIYSSYNLKTSYFVAVGRGGDRIVVYKGEYSMQSISDDAYSNSKFFNSIEQVVDWLVDELTGKH